MNDYREVLYTVDKTGFRKWVYSLVERSGWYRPRKIAAWVLIAFYLLLPWTTVNGNQAVLLDIPGRKFQFLGATFFATDTIYLFFILAGLAISLFLFTAVFGRIWCGWACPETVFMEFVFRPIERLLEGSADQRRRLDAGPLTVKKAGIKITKYLAFSLVSWVLASTALALFLGRENLLAMIQKSPAQNPEMFFLTLCLMACLLFQFGWFREQFCTIVCPYGRLQAVLLDENSILVGYDEKRGEPRGKLEKNGPGRFGDCIDCKYCVRVCPTGIDIRNGLQLECIQCAQCADACNSVMAKIGRPAGLIRYDTATGLKGEKSRIVRPRVVLYFTALFVCILSFSVALSGRTSFEFQVLRGAADVPFTIQYDGKILNHLSAAISNKKNIGDKFQINMTLTPGIDLIAPVNPFPVKSGGIGRAPLIFRFNKETLVNGKRSVQVYIQSESGEELHQNAFLIGPDR